MALRFFSLCLISLLIFSCSEEKKQQREKRKLEQKPFVFEMQHFFSEAEDNVSFPVWFDDSLIHEKKVKTIRRKVFRLNNKEGKDLPKTEKIYLFNEQGEITSLQTIDYYDGSKVSDVTFQYSGVKDANGFQSVEFGRNEHLEEDLAAYVTYQKEKEATNFLAYRNENDGSYLFFLMNERHWGTLSVDSILMPNPEDAIVFGTPKKPRKRYHVVNRVNEFDSKEIEYGSSDEPLKIRFEREPFNYRRSILYDESGNCNGFVDSTFSMSEYIMRRHSQFVIGTKGLPKKVKHVSSKTSKGSKNEQLETFEYTYYE